MFNITGGTVSGNIVGSGSLDTVNFDPGTGNTFTYADNFTGIHQANVTSGTVVLNGNNTATGMTVSNGGTLAGTGFIASSITIDGGGTLAPGLPGTAGGVLTISGTVSFASTAYYLDTIDGLSASLTQITGTGLLNNATLTLAGTVSAGHDLHHHDRHWRRIRRRRQYLQPVDQLCRPGRHGQLQLGRR